MKAISLWQPYGTLIAIEAKHYETRSWSTSYRGPILIHAAKNNNGCLALESAIYRLRPSDQKEIHSYVPGTFFYCAIKALYDFHKKPYGAFIPKLPLGAALCIADLVEVVPTEAIVGQLSQQERAFGDYSHGRYAWKFSNITRLNSPMPMKGGQRLFEVAFDPTLNLQPHTI